MTIKAASSRQTDTLIADLGAANPVTRETAVARLTLLGARAVERLIVTAQSAVDPNAGAAAWRTLEAIADPRALEPALAVLRAAELEPVVGSAAIGVVRIHLRGAHGAAAVDRLASLLMDRTRHDTIRLAALRALRDLEPSTIAPIASSLADDPNLAIRAEARLSGKPSPSAPENPRVVLARAADGDLPADPATLRQALTASNTSVPLSVILRVVDRVREREGSQPAVAKEQWRLTRAAAHVALASRGSRLALYDLRESLETAKTPLPVEFLAALTSIGDTSCLEPIATAYSSAKDEWWRDHLARAFREIIAREKLTRRHAALRRIEKRWPGAVNDMAKG